jgi:hypothetical protein
MGITHTNRKDIVYYLHQRQSRKGTPTYHFSKASSGTLAETIPAGYEVYENVNGQVFLRRIIPRNVRPEEVGLVEDGIREYTGMKIFLLDVTRDAIEVYLPNYTRQEALDLIGYLTGGLPSAESVERLQSQGSFSPMLRFVLRDRQEDIFTVQRWCYRGSIDNWTYDLDQGKLATLVSKYAPHLGKESFFELM